MCASKEIGTQMTVIAQNEEAVRWAQTGLQGNMGSAPCGSLPAPPGERGTSVPAWFPGRATRTARLVP